MKIRNGFISNSSSSSFIIIGYDISGLDDKDVYDHLPRRRGIGILSGEEYGLKDGQTVIGVYYCWDPDAGNCGQTEMKKVYEDLKILPKVVGADERPLKLFWGSSYS